MSTLYMVATPIGNLKDITLRALEILGSVEVIACEDTRHTLRLLNAHGISKRLISCRSQNEAKAALKVVELLEEGHDVAYASDAGTPGLSDPGAVLVRIVREAGFKILPIPGASALAALQSVSGFGGRTIVFDGFLSPKGGKRRTRLKELLERGETFAVYESPFRVVKLLEDLDTLAPDCEILIGREMTKLYEEFIEGSPADLLQDFKGRSTIKGEFVLLVNGKKKR
ncbi:MAG: 16S rRNA (cytidine(1402)-2'-O)-methyltransferase [Spirochaetales bacterium]|nr:16S rRNA (cytidine(1402)-2'-O)-methyltransferase [Spirochaetales bacterium]